MNTLWYEQPAKDWNEALPLGNGRLGAMVFGGPATEHLQLNEDSVWYGKHIDRINPSALMNLGKVRQLILAGKIAEAEELLVNSFTGMPQGMRGYQTLGEVDIVMKGIKKVRNYRRELSLDEAIHRVSFDTDEGNHFLRETFISAVDDVIVMRISTNMPGTINMNLSMGRDRFFDEVWTESPNLLAYQGNLGKGGFDFCNMCKVKAIGGSVSSVGEHILVTDADEVMVCFTAATTYRYDNPVGTCRKILGAIENIKYPLLLERHTADYKSYYDRLRIELPYHKSLDKIPTDKRIGSISDDNPDNGLLVTYLQFGRYLLISCSRPGTLPATLQGIWNKDMVAPWDSTYTINIKAQRNSWPAEIGNLSELHLPLFDLLEKVAESGKDTARRMYDCKGFVAHHNTDIYGDSAPQDTWIPGTYWVMGGAWLCTHLWEHYLFTKDIEFLKKYYHIIKESVAFFEDFLIEDKGYLITCPSVSPENTYIRNDGTRGSICAGATMDNEILHDLFGIYIKAAEELQVDSEHVLKIAALKALLPPIKIGKHGQIMEWLEDYEEAEPGHRHISQLYGLYPSTQITMDGTPELAKAAQKTLERRLRHGGGHTGWSLAWIINIYARLWDEDNAYKNLIRLMRQSTLPNMFDNHPPFQIDGNFGGTAGMLEMLVQSNDNRVILLPALAKEWPEGKLEGVCLRGGAELNLYWEKNALTQAEFIAKKDIKLSVVYQEEKWEIELKENEVYMLIR
ncbi:MAG: glycoside hydrolase family 95 protein [Mobilitalea sp.]